MCLRATSNWVFSEFAFSAPENRFFSWLLPVVGSCLLKLKQASFATGVAALRIYTASVSDRRPRTRGPLALLSLFSDVPARLRSGRFPSPDVTGDVVAFFCISNGCGLLMSGCCGAADRWIFKNEVVRGEKWRSWLHALDAVRREIMAVRQVYPDGLSARSARSYSATACVATAAPP